MTLAIAEAQAQVSPDGRRSVSVFDAISSRQHSTQKMQSAVRIPFVFLCFLVAGIAGQDVQPEMPVDFPASTTDEAITEAPLTTSTTLTTKETATNPTTITPPETTTFSPPETTIIPPTETPTIPPTEQPIEITTTELTTTSTTEPTTILITTTELTTTSTTEPTTILITTTESTTTSTTEPTTISSPTTTQKDPIYPTYQPPSLPPYMRPTTSRRPIYTTRNPWNWNEPAERCYLKEQHQYITPCWGFGWKSSFTCYRCCYYGHSNFAGCSKLHQGRCWWFD